MTVPVSWLCCPKDKGIGFAPVTKLGIATGPGYTPKKQTHGFKYNPILYAAFASLFPGPVSGTVKEPMNMEVPITVI